MFGSSFIYRIYSFVRILQTTKAALQVMNKAALIYNYTAAHTDITALYMYSTHTESLPYACACYNSKHDD